MLVPHFFGVDTRLETGRLKVLAIVGKGDAATLVIGEHRTVQAFVCPPDFTVIKARLRDGARREELRAKRGGLEDAQAWR